MTHSQKSFLFDLLQTPSPAGFEHTGQKLWIKQVKKYADNVETDAYGNAWATIKGTSKKSIMLEAHADEIGFMVKYISEKGFISIDRIGGMDAAVARGRRVNIYGDKESVTGVIGNTAIHLRDRKDGEKVPEVHELFVDVGAKDAKEIEKMGIRVGHSVVYVDGVTEIGKHCIAARALDNRLGGFIIAEVLRELKRGKKPAWTVHAVNAVQEEVGGYGAKMVTQRLAPDVALVFDVSHATDTPGIKKEQHGDVELFSGPTVTHGGCNHPAVVERLLQIAKKQKLSVQHEASSRFSGTDANIIFHMHEGIPSALVSLPLRYMHSVVEMIDMRNVEKTVKLLTGFVKGLRERGLSRKWMY